MDKKTQTVLTYNQSAQQLADKFDRLGARVADIEEVFALVEGDAPMVLEIGCGNGRDAAVICQKTPRYLGIDVSEKLIELARQKVPQGHFEIFDVETYPFPQKIDIVFAFASLIHTPKEVLRGIFAKIFDALMPGGLFRLSMKWSDPASEVTKDDEFGTRTYYLYSQGDIEELGSQFRVLKSEVGELKGQMWLEVLLQKPVLSSV